MDITGIVQDYQEIMGPWTQAQQLYQEKVLDTGMGYLPGLLFILGFVAVLVSVCIASSGMIETKKEKVVFSVIAYSGVAMIAVGAILGWTQPPAPDHELRQEAEDTFVSEVAEDATDFYGVEVSEDIAREAFEATDDAVISFGALHDGESKSLGLQIDMEEKLAVVYQGNAELEPTE